MDRLLQITLSNALAAMALALAAGAAARLLRHPPLTRALWILVLLKLLTPPLWTLPILKYLPTSGPAPAPLVAAARELVVAPVETITPAEAAAPVEEPIDYENPPPLDPDPFVQPTPVEVAQPQPLSVPIHLADYWSEGLCGIWLIGAAIYAGMIARATLRVRRIVAQRIPAPRLTTRRALELSRTMNLRRCPRITFVRGNLPPMLCAIAMRPRIVLPASLWARLDDAQRDTVLIHELAHLRQRDHWVRALELLASVIYWWHPAVWWSRSELREASEQCCDGWVLWTMPRLARSYAQALIEAVDFISLARPAVPVLASGMGQFTDLRRRLVMIKHGSASRSLSRPALAAVCSLAGLLLPLAPGFAQEAPPAPKAPVEVIAPVAPDAPAPRAAPFAPDAPKANILISPVPSGLASDDAAPDPKQNRAELDQARAEVARLRTQLRNAERHVSDIERQFDRAQAEKDRAQAQRDRAQAREERLKADQDRRANEALARAAKDPTQQPGEQFGYASVRPSKGGQNQNPDYVQASVRLKAAGAQMQNSRDSMERRLDQMEKQLNEMVGQLRQMKRQASQPDPDQPEPQKK